MHGQTHDSNTHIISHICTHVTLHVLLQVKAIEKKDSVLTGPQQIDQLLRPGSTYFNLRGSDYYLSIVCQLVLVLIFQLA